MRDSSRQPDSRRSLLSNRDMMVRRGHHITGPRGARDAPRTGVGIRAVSGRRAVLFLGFDLAIASGASMRARSAGSAHSAAGSPAPGPSSFAEEQGRPGGTRGWVRPPGSVRAPGSFPDRRSRRPDGPGGVVQAGAGPAARPVDALPGRPAAAVCPNLPQRPGSSRNAGRESLIFRASPHGRSRRGAPLWQIWTHPSPGSPQESHQHHADAPRITFPFCTWESFYWKPTF